METPTERRERKVRRGRNIGILYIASMALFALILVGAFVWRGHQTAKAERESRRADYAQCIVLNAQRKDNRKMASILYGTLADRLRFDPPQEQKLEDSFKLKLAQLQRLLEAQRPLNCLTYVRPDLPPDRGN